MSSYVFRNALRAFCAGEIDLDTADIRVILCMSNTTVENVGQEEATTVSALSLDERRRISSACVRVS
jgi:hypothetical protein